MKLHHYATAPHGFYAVLSSGATSPVFPTRYDAFLWCRSHGIKTLESCK
jgi:hypothetical protein